MPTEFHPFGIHHAIVVLAAAFAWVLVLRLDRRLGACGRGPTLRRALAAFIVVFNVAWFVWRALPPNWNIDSSLPLHLCDLAWMNAAFVLVDPTTRRLPRDLTYFWGIGLCTQAFITPTLTDGPLALRYWSFWVSHWQIVAVSLLVLVADRHRPGPGSLIRVLALTVAFFAASVAFNAAFDTPYCFTGSGTPENPTVIDRLGAWPDRLFVLGALGAGWFGLLALPYVAMAKRRRDH